MVLTVFLCRGRRATDNLAAKHLIHGGTPIRMEAGERHIADVMFERLKDHCAQPLFLLRMARWFRARGEAPSAESA